VPPQPLKDDTASRLYFQEKKMTRPAHGPFLPGGIAGGSGPIRIRIASSFLHTSSIVQVGMAG